MCTVCTWDFYSPFSSVTVADAVAFVIVDVVVLSVLIEYNFIIKSQFRNLFSWYSSFLQDFCLYPVIVLFLVHCSTHCYLILGEILGLCVVRCCALSVVIVVWAFPFPLVFVWMFRNGLIYFAFTLFYRVQQEDVSPDFSCLLFVCSLSFNVICLVQYNIEIGPNRLESIHVHIA